jgi:hypothetical protein
MARDDRTAAHPPLPRPWASSSTLTVLVIVAIALTLVLLRGGDVTGPSFTDARCAAVREWQATHRDAPDLHVVSTEVTFLGKPGDFAIGEGIVAVPLAATFAGVQDVVDVRATPPPSRVMRVDGNVVVA